MPASTPPPWTITAPRPVPWPPQRLYAAAHDAGLKPGHWDARIVEGDASQRIVEHEQESDCDLVVVGKHGQSAAEELLLGSVTKHVLDEGSADVLVSTAKADAAG